MTSATEFLASITAEYTVENGTIRNPGKFECEPVWVPYFWDLVLNGEGEDVTPEDCDDDAVIRYTEFTVDAEEAEAFGLECGAKVAVWEDAQGFVIGEVLG